MTNKNRRPKQMLSVKSARLALICMLISDAIKIMHEGQRLGPPKLTDEQFEHAQTVSRSATRRLEEVPMTPILKHMLYASGDLKEDERLLVSDKETKVEAWLQAFCRAGIEELFHAGLPDKYDMSKGPADPSHYVVDCVRNIPSNFRHQWVKPKRTLEEAVNAFRKPKAKPDCDFFTFMKSPGGAVAMDYLDNQIPRVAAEHKFELTAGPFEHRDSNTGLKDARNARLKVPGTDMTYGQKAVATAEHTPLNALWEFNGYITLARFQRGSERNIMGSSSVVNSSLNRQTAPEIAAYKSVPLYVGYNDANMLKAALIAKTEFCERHGFWCMNYDQAHYDSNITPEMKAYVDAFLHYKAVGSLGKDVSWVRGVLGQQGWLITPWDKGFVRIYPRMFSGEIQTNKNECLISALTNIGCVWEQDPQYCQKILYADRYAVIALGDDLNITVDPDAFSIATHIEAMKKLGLEVHPLDEKGEFGAFFLQFRLIKMVEGYIMVRPFPRVFRSLFFRERPAGLGPAGWTLAFWSILSGLIEYPDVLAFVVRTVIDYDEWKLGTDKSVAEIIAAVNEEDRVAMEQDPARGRTTGDILYDGDPQKAEFFDTSGDHVRLRESAYLRTIHQALVAAATRPCPAYEAAIAKCPFPKAT